MGRKLLALCLTIALSTPAFAQGQPANQPTGEDFFKNLTYPELEVTPRASERLEMEAKREVTGRWWVHAPIQISAVATLVAATMAKGKPTGKTDTTEPSDTQIEANKYATNFGTFVGAGWLITTIVLSATYTPYLEGFARIRKMPDKSTREQLARERMSEEYMEGPQRLASRMEYVAVATNLLAALAIMGTSEFDPMVAGLGAALLSFSPILFEHRWAKVGRTQDEYKKRIYGPVSSVLPYQNENGSVALAPAFSLSYSW